jgi:F-type H+-transporting ATPase subunit h
MYLRELGGYKPTPLKPNDSEGHVQKFAVPKAPTSPEESNISNELTAYESQQPDIEGQSADGTPVAEEHWFEEEEDELAAAH